MKTGRAIIEDIDSCEVNKGQLTFWWLGQHGFVIKMGAKVIYIDAFLSEFECRKIPPLLSPSEITNADIVIGSHDHEDHIDRSAWPEIAASSPEAIFVMPDILKETVSEGTGIQISRFIGLDDMTSIDIDGVKITGIASAHEFLDQDPETRQYPYLGYVMESNGIVIYHSGDCCIYEGLLTKLRNWQLDVVFLPINGRDAIRYSNGCIGNMTYQEAADLAGALKPSLTVPAHFEMFAGNTEDPQLFVDYMHVKYSTLDVHVPHHGERFIYSGG